jgi:hypothetical protein
LYFLLTFSKKYLLIIDYRIIVFRNLYNLLPLKVIFCDFEEIDEEIDV